MGFRLNFEGSATLQCTYALSRKGWGEPTGAVRNGLMRELFCSEKALRDQRKVLLKEVGYFCCFWKLCASLRAWFVLSQDKKKLFFFFSVLFSLASLLPELFCYRVLPFFLAQRLAQKMWCAYSTRKSVMLVLRCLFFFFFCNTCACFLCLSHGRGKKGQYNAFWCCSVKRHSCIWFDFFFLFWHWWCWNGAIVLLELPCC